MEFIAMETFIPSGVDMNKSKQLFLDLGFSINWDAGDYIGFQKDNCRFILQKFEDKHFAENLMVREEVADLDAFWDKVNALDLPRKFDVKLARPTEYPYGREMHLIDIAGVCWHFAQQKN
jgi:hypothetical protein